MQEKQKVTDETQIPGKLWVYGSDATIALKDRIIQDHYWEWYSENNIASITYENVEKLKFDAQKGSLTINGNVEIGIAPSAKLHVNGDLMVEKGTTIKGLCTANKGLNVSGGALTVDGGLTVNTGGARIGGELANVKSPAYSTPLAIRASGNPKGLMCFEAKIGEEWIRKWDICLGTIGPKSGLEFIETDVDHGRLFLQEGGNVGIGTMDPKARMHVAGDLRVDSGATINDILTANKGLTVNGGNLTVNAGNVGIGTKSPGGKLDVLGDIRAGNSDIYFTKTDHKHTGIGNTDGCAAIENAADYGALMILGRAGTPKGRKVQLWDYLQVKGGMDIIGPVGIGTESPETKLHVAGDLKVNGNVLLDNRKWLYFGSNIWMGSWVESNGIWFGIFFNGRLISYCNLNTGLWWSALYEPEKAPRTYPHTYSRSFPPQ